jgi:hypothetical protein
VTDAASLTETSWRKRATTISTLRDPYPPHGQTPSTTSEGAGLTAKARTEQSSILPRCASSSDTVREIKYQILHLKAAPFDRRVKNGVGRLHVHFPAQANHRRDRIEREWGLI